MVKLLKATAEFLPLGIFLYLYNYSGMMLAIQGLLVATFISLIALLATTRKINWVLLCSALFVLAFGGTSLYFDNPNIIKMKPTIFYTFFAIALFTSASKEKYILQKLFGEVLEISSDDWKRLTNEFAIFFLICALLNESVWRTQAEATWVNFKVFGLTLLNIGFTLLQFGRRHKSLKK
jgi:intracellular septation protein